MSRFSSSSVADWASHRKPRDGPVAALADPRFAAITWHERVEPILRPQCRAGHLHSHDLARGVFSGIRLSCNDCGGERIAVTAPPRSGTARAPTRHTLAARGLRAGPMSVRHVDDDNVQARNALEVPDVGCSDAPSSGD